MLPSYKDNAFPLYKKNTNLTSGVIKNNRNLPSVFLCSEDGTLTVTYTDATTKAIACIAGNAFTFLDAETITITTGTFQVGV